MENKETNNNIIRPKTNWLKAYVIEVLPCMSLALYALALIYNIAFYSVFNINILSHVTLSELLLCIIEPILVVSIYSVIVLFLFYVFNTFPNKGLKILGARSKNDRYTNYKLQRKLVFLTGYVIKIKKMDIKTKKLRKEILETILVLCVLFFIFVVSFLLFKNKEIVENTDFGLDKATFGLTFPITLLCFLYLVIIYISLPISFKIPEILTEYLKRICKEWAFLIIMSYFIYAILIFFTSGIESGNYYQENNRVEFEIKTTDGTVYNNSMYSYIGQTNERIFLREKKTDRNVILNSKTFLYSKFDGKVAPISIFVKNFKGED